MAMPDMSITGLSANRHSQPSRGNSQVYETKFSYKAVGHAPTGHTDLPTEKLAVKLDYKGRF